LTNQVSADQKPWAISFHITGEFTTAILLIAAAVGLWLDDQWAKILAPIALGMLLYTVIVSPGYYAQLNNLPMVGVFLILVILTVIAIMTLFKY